MAETHDTRSPLLHALVQNIGRPVGIRWVGDQHLAIIERFNRFDGFKGPGFFWINPLTQRHSRDFPVAPHFVKTSLPGIQTQDAVPTEVTINVSYLLNPRLLSKDKQLMVLRMSGRDLELYIADTAQRALQSVLPQHHTREIVSGQAYPLVESELHNELAKLVAPLGISLRMCRVIEMKVPDLVRTRYEQNAQREANIAQIQKQDPALLAQAVRIEMVEAMPHMSVNRMMINPTDLSGDVALPDPNQLPGGPTPSHPSGPAAEPPPPDGGSGSASGDIINGTARPIDDEPISRL